MYRGGTYFNSGASSRNNSGTSSGVVRVNASEAVNQKDTFYTETVEILEKVAKNGQHLYTPGEVIDIIKTAYGSVHNLFQYCGPGTYLLLGPSDSGKTSALESLFKTSQMFATSYGRKPLLWTSILAFSGTHEITKDLRWAGTLLVPMPMSMDTLKETFEKRAEETILAAKLYNQSLEYDDDEDYTGSEDEEDVKEVPPKDHDKQKMTAEAWAVANPIAIILDDFHGLIGAESRTGPISTMSTKARKLGIYLILLSQALSQTSITIRENVRAIIAFRLNYQRHSNILQAISGSQPPEDLNQLRNHNLQMAHPVVHILSWELSRPEYGSIPPISKLCLPPFPLYQERQLVSKKDFEAIEDSIKPDGTVDPETEREIKQELKDMEDEQKHGKELSSKFNTPWSQNIQVKIEPVSDEDDDDDDSAGSFTFFRNQNPTARTSGTKVKMEQSSVDHDHKKIKIEIEDPEHRLEDIRKDRGELKSNNELPLEWRRSRSHFSDMEK